MVFNSISFTWSSAGCILRHLQLLLLCQISILQLIQQQSIHRMCACTQVERFMRREEGRSWLEGLVKDKEAWARLTERGAATNELLQGLFATLVSRAEPGAALAGVGGRKRKWGW